jgi:hypothetical protein
VAPSRVPAHQGNGYHQNLPPLNPVFGISLEDLYRRDSTAVPMIVYQCVQAVERFGLDLEGIYRLSGSSTHINQMKSLFDNGKSTAPCVLIILTPILRQIRPRWTLPTRKGFSMMSTV